MFSPRQSRQPRQAMRGFTLLEIMLAVTITAMVITVVYSAWHVAFQAWQESTKVTDSLHRQRVVMETLTDLTESAVYFSSSDDIYGVLGEDNTGYGDKISFVTSSDAALPPGEVVLLGLRRVTLVLEQDNERQTYLALANDPAAGLPLGESEEVWHELSRDVIGFEVRYQDPRDDEWYDSWREDLTLPKSIEYTVTFAAVDEQNQPVAIVRRVMLPSADYAMRNKGRRPDAPSRSGTNTTERAGTEERTPDSGGEESP